MCVCIRLLVDMYVVHMDDCMQLCCMSICVQYLVDMYMWTYVCRYVAYVCVRLLVDMYGVHMDDCL